MQLLLLYVHVHACSFLYILKIYMAAVDNSSRIFDTNDDASLLNEESHVSRRLKPTVLTEKWCRRFRSNVLPLFRELCGEFVGTFLAILIIITVAATQTLLDAAGGLWQVAVVSGLGVSLSIYVTGHVSDSHLNPAVTVAFALVRWKLFSWKKVIPYIVVQIAAGFLAGAMLYALYSESIDLFEKRNHIVRGSDESVRTAMIFGEYFPNPGFAVVKNGSSSVAAMVVSPLKAMAIEAWATGILVFMIFSFSDPNNSSVGSSKNKVAVPILIGLTVAVLTSIYAPLTQAGMNPARDFGPRLFAATAGWGRIAIPGPRNGFWAYIVGPLIGGLTGGTLYDWVVARQPAKQDSA